MPMTTMLSKSVKPVSRKPFSPCSAPSQQTNINCAMISPDSKLRFQPAKPDAQNLHPCGQPTCVEMQTVLRERGSSPTVCGARKITHSTNAPSRICNNNFSVSSPAAFPVINFAGIKSNSASKRSRNAFGKFVISAKDFARRL